MPQRRAHFPDPTFAPTRPRIVERLVGFGNGDAAARTTARRKTLRGLLRISLPLLCAWGLSGAPSVQAKDVTALKDEDPASVLASVFSLSRSEYGPDGDMVKVFELGGGDPAMNGAFIYLCIEHHANVRVWNTGVNVRKIDRITLLPENTVVISVTEDFLDKSASISSRKATYRFQFFSDGDTILDRLSILKK